MKVILTGATGMVGGEVLRHALDRPEIAEAISLGRRLPPIDHAKLTDIRVDDFLDHSAHLDRIEGAALCCHCLAAYVHRVGRAEYRVITLGYLDALLRALEAVSPGAAFCIFTTEGARQDGRSLIRTLNVKGEAERLVLESRLPRRFVFRPGYIHPSRTRERPLFYDFVSRPVFRLMPSIGIDAADLARVMVETGLHDPRTEAVIENREIRAMAAAVA